ncbi:MAG: Lrp/AsnC family transcriptional regulator [Beijerinckiaceae bacterium]
MPYIALDSIDLKILSALQSDGRLSNHRLADAVGLSPSPCLRRVKRLETDGFITGYRALVDRSSVALSQTVFASIKIDRPSHERILKLEEAFSTLPHVVACHRIAGDADFMLEIVVPNMRGYEIFLNESLLSHPEIGDVRSTFVLSSAKADAPLPLDHIRRPHPAPPQAKPDC